MRKPKLIISKCLNSEKCRYNGQSYDDKVISLLRKYVDLETVCPETGIGLKVPRNPIRIEKYDDKYKLVEPSDNIDYTSQMMEFAEEFLSNIDDVDGFILKSKSPSCGIRDVKVYHKNLSSLGFYHNLQLYFLHLNHIQDLNSLNLEFLSSHMKDHSLSLLLF